MTGKVQITGTGTNPNISLNGDTATITAGYSGTGAILSLHDATANLFWGVLINAQNRSFTINKPNSPGAYPVVTLNGATGNGAIGGNQQDGDLGIYPASVQGAAIHNDMNSASIHLDGKNGNIRLGGNGLDGDIFLFPASATGDVTNNFSKATIHLDGDAGDIVLQNADCAEDFEIIDAEQVEPGTVMVIAEDGGLRCSRSPYDKRVAGVVSGANALRPGIILGRRPSTGTRHAIALAGQVYCKADAAYSPIELGDLLTTSGTIGHAMRASNPQRAFGTVIGKALSPLKEGRGLIRMLVALQ